MDSTRQQKINKLLLRDLSEIFQRESRTLFHGAMISVTTVRVSPDLGFAKVYLSIFAPGKETTEIFDQVNENNKKIRSILGSKVKNQLRVVPELAFYIDDSLDYIENIENILKK